MKRVLFFFLLILSFQCGHYNEYVEERKWSPVDRIHLVWQDWADHPEHFLMFLQDMAPIKICDTDRIVNEYFKDPLLPDSTRDKCKSIFTTLYEFGEQTYYVVAYGTDKQKEFYFYSLADNTFVSFSVLGPLMFVSSELEGFNMIRTSEGIFVYGAIKFSEYLGKIQLFGRSFFLLEGTEKWGMLHIRFHFPEEWISKTLPKGKHLFLESREEYILDLLKRFEKSPNIRELKHKRTRFLRTYETEITNKYGITRTYRLTVSNDGRIITFFPVRRLPKNIAINFPEYYQVVYKY